MSNPHWSNARQSKSEAAVTAQSAPPRGLSAGVMSFQDGYPQDNPLGRMVVSKWFATTILGVILLAAALVGLETSPELMERYGGIIHGLDEIVLWIFVVEALVKMAAHGRRFYRYFLDPWNVFDFVIVVVCFLPFDSQYAAVLRLARILRALRLVTAVPSLQLLVGSLLKSIPSMFYVGVLLLILFYMYAVMGVFLFSANDPVHFGDLALSMLSLFRVVTLEDWTDVMYIQMFGSNMYADYDGLNSANAPTKPRAMPLVGAVYFVSFVMLGTMIMLNLFIGVIISSMDEARKEREEEQRQQHISEIGHATVGDDMARLEHELEDLTEKLRLLRGRLSE